LNKSKIEWCDYTINPVKGLCPMACDYCYARRMYKRFKWNPAIRIDEEILRQPLAGKPGDRYFVGSTMELFGPWVDQWMLKLIFNWVASYPERIFIFLTKQPENLKKLSPFPDNCWIGVSTTNWLRFSDALGHLMTINARAKFLSFEPLLERIEFDMLQKILLPDAINWIIIGQQTPARAATAPKVEWIKEIVAAADSAGIPVFLKDNLSKLLPDSWLRQEFPL